MDEKHDEITESTGGGMPKVVPCEHHDPACEYFNGRELTCYRGYRPCPFPGKPARFGLQPKVYVYDDDKCLESATVDPGYICYKGHTRSYCQQAISDLMGQVMQQGYLALPLNGTVQCLLTHAIHSIDFELVELEVEDE